MTDSYIVHLDQADVTEILGALDAKIRDALDHAAKCRDEPNAAWWLTRARAMAAVVERIAVELWGSSAAWLSPDVLRRLDEAEAATEVATPEDSRTLAVR